MLVFVDESGHPHPKDNTNNPVILGVCIAENDIRAITNDIYKLKENIFHRQDEFKANQIITKATILKNRTQAKSYADIFVNTVCGFDISVFSIIMDKPDHVIKIPEDHLPKQYYYLLKKGEFYSEKHNINKSIFVFDEQNEKTDTALSNSFNGFLFRSKFGKQFDRILEMPLFVNSKTIPAIQIADIFAGITRIYYENHLDERTPSNDFENWINELFTVIKSKSENILQPSTRFMEYGFQKVGTNLDY